MLTTAPTLDQLYGAFPDSPDRPRATPVPAAAVPPPYNELLVHCHHMTVVVEAFYGSPVDVRVLCSRRNEDEYSRKILLITQSTGKVVQFGLVRINLNLCPEPVREEILAGQAPLGRVLIRHNMLRRIEPITFLRVVLSADMATWFGVEPETVTFGRIGVIYSGEQPAVEVLEILAPVPAALQS
jgi:chorismate-pyruvate lyase